MRNDDDGYDNDDDDNDLLFLILYVRVNNFTVMSERTSTKKRIKFLAQGNNSITPPVVRIELAILRTPV